jgi:hypothetical protein
MTGVLDNNNTRKNKEVNMEVVFRGEISGAICTDHYIDLEFDWVTQDVEQGLQRIKGKYVSVTIKEIKEPAKNETPICYEAAGVA